MSQTLCGSLIAERAGFQLGQDYYKLADITHFQTWRSIYTPEPINCPLLEVLKRNFSYWGQIIEVQSVRIVLILVRSGSELFFLMIEGTSPLWIYAIVVLPYHSRSTTDRKSIECIACSLVADKSRQERVG